MILIQLLLHELFYLRLFRFVDAGQSVKKGDKLGVISDYFGNIIDTYYAEFDSTILYNTVAYSVPKGSSLVAYGRV